MGPLFHIEARADMTECMIHSQNGTGKMSSKEKIGEWYTTVTKVNAGTKFPHI